MFERTTRKLTFHADPSHGWLEIPATDVHALHLTPSEYSYINGDKAYLEEDCDANAYLERAKSAGWVINITEKYTDTDSVIRTYPHITLDMFWNPTCNPHLFKASNED
jgi:hypothetical protein